MKRLLLICTCILLAGCSGAASSPAPSRAQVPVCTLRVGGVAIDVSHAALVAALKRQAARDQTAGQQTNDSARQMRAISQVVADQLWSAMAKERSIHISKTQMDAYMQRVLQQSFMGETDLRDQVLGLTGWKLADWRDHEQAVYAYELAKITDAQARAATSALHGNCQDALLGPGRHPWTQAQGLAVYRARPSTA